MRSARHRLVTIAFSACVAFGSLGCGRDLLQTASLESSPEAATSCEDPVKTLPTPPSWVNDKSDMSPLAGGSYGAGAGPGLWITARDAYRVYLNGALLGTSKTPRSAEFVPVSLVPGDNQLIVAVWAASGTPAALLQLDDLTQSYVGDDAWRVESSPLADFAAADYEPTSSVKVTAFGRLGALPGCDPTSAFPLESLARWIGPAPGTGTSAVLRQTIRITPEGYGAAATGGGAAAPVVVTSWEDLQKLASDPDAPATLLIPEGTWDYRRKGGEAKARLVCPTTCTEDATKTLFTVLNSTETCANPQVMKTLDERKLAVGSNKTIVGLGRGARLRGVNVDLGASHNVILRNLALYDVNRTLIEAGDAISIGSAKDVWLDHLTTKWISDGLTDISAGSQNITLSWLRYDGLSTEACRGHHPRASQITDATVTLHHCFYVNADSHTPLVTGMDARVHIFNNVVQDNASYGVGSACGAQVLLEGTTFENVVTPTTKRDCADMPPTGLISAAKHGNSYLTDVGKHAGGDGTEPADQVFGPAYDYQLDDAARARPQVRDRAGAGGIWAIPLTLDE